MRNTSARRKGQVLVMGTLALAMISGILGLAVDLGWSYFRRKAAQAAVDAAALASAQQVLDTVGEDGPWNCGFGMTCQETTQCPQPVPSPPSNNIETGCLYASRNGFTAGGNSGRQNVTMRAGVSSSPPTAPGVFANYWVTATAVETIPQLFSAILGYMTGTSGARASAAVIDSIVPGSLVLLNREDDCLPMGNANSHVCGVDALIQANDNQGLHALQAEGGIMMASTKNGTSADGRYAGEDTGGGTVSAPFTLIRGAGNYTLSGNAVWTLPPQNGKSDTAYFKDPLTGKGQPAPPRGLPDRYVEGGQISGSNDPANPLVLQPGNYFATSVDAQGRYSATGEPIRLSGYIRFSDGGTGFGNYVFFGGVTNQSAGTTVTFGPGRYLFAGALAHSSTPNPLFDIRVNMVVQDETTGYGTPTNAGEIFIFTDTNYRGGPEGELALEIPALVQPIQSQLKQGMSGFQSGNASSTYINLHGLNRDHAALPSDLKLFAPIILWQDQANSVIKYTPSGHIDRSCGQPQCPNASLLDARSTELAFQASPSLHLWGVSYQPRGSWTSMLGGGGYDAPLQLITGSLKVHANSNVRLRPLNLPLVRTAVGLVE